MAAKDETSTESPYPDLGPLDETATEAEREERADAVYARYSAAMTFFGETPSPKGKPQRD